MAHIPDEPFATAKEALSSWAREYPIPAWNLQPYPPGTQAGLADSWANGIEKYLNQNGYEIRTSQGSDDEVRRKTLMDFYDQLGRVIERTDATVTDRKVQACQAVGLRMARLVAIETADKIGRKPGEEH